jgi:hypothetical protein
MQLVAPIAGQDFKPGSIGFCKTQAHGLMADFSHAISWFENKEESDGFEKALGENTPDAPSHVFGCIGKDDKGVEKIIHAYAGGVQISDLSMFLAAPNIQVVFRDPLDMTDDDAQQIIAGLRSILGHPYNYPGLAGRAIVVATPLHHWDWYMRQPLLINAAYRALGLPEPYYCSAAASHGLKHDPKYAMAPLFKRMDESKVMPSTLYAEGPFKALNFSKTHG